MQHIARKCEHLALVTANSHSLRIFVCSWLSSIETHGLLVHYTRHVAMTSMRSSQEQTSAVTIFRIKGRILLRAPILTALGWLCQACHQIGVLLVKAWLQDADPTDRGVVSMWPRQSDSTRTDGPSGVILTTDPLFTNTLRPTIVWDTLHVVRVVLYWP